MSILATSQSKFDQSIVSPPPPSPSADDISPILPPLADSGGSGRPGSHAATSVPFPAPKVESGHPASGATHHLADVPAIPEADGRDLVTSDDRDDRTMVGTPDRTDRTDRQDLPRQPPGVCPAPGCRSPAWWQSRSDPLAESLHCLECLPPPLPSMVGARWMVWLPRDRVTGEYTPAWLRVDRGLRLVRD